MNIDVVMPTKNSGSVLKTTLERLDAAQDTISVDRLIIIDDLSTDDTIEIVKQSNFDTVICKSASNLPEAREKGIGLVETEWFLFLDDDVRISTDYLTKASRWINVEHVGAVQGRKKEREEENPTRWKRRRSRRGGTHATILRTNCVSDIRIPSELTVLEDEYIRRHVESNKYLWIQDPWLIFKHANQERHPIGWEEGRIAGKYGLKPFHEVALNVPYAVIDGRNPMPHIQRSLGWFWGRMMQ